MGIYSLNIFKRMEPLLGQGTLLLAAGFRFRGTAKRLKLIRSVFVHRLSLGLALRARSRELYYSPTHHGPIFYRRKILTIHDISPLLIPSKSLKQHIYYRYLLRMSVRYCICIITVSRFTKALLEKHYGLPSDKILVIPCGTDVEKVESAPMPELEQHKFFLMAGVASEYKNYRRVLEAWKLLDRQDLTLVITSNNPYIGAYCSAHRGVIVKSYVSFNEMVFLYRNAVALVYPSIMEGFGLPALEAARLGTPIITSKDSSMEEFLGKGNALFVDPIDVSGILAAMVQVADGRYLDAMLQGAHQATITLTWENTVAGITRVLEEAQAGLP